MGRMLNVKQCCLLTLVIFMWKSLMGNFVVSFAFTNQCSTCRNIQRNNFLYQTTSDAETKSISTSSYSTPYEENVYLDEYIKALSEVLTTFRVMQKNDDPEDLEFTKQFLFANQRRVDTHLTATNVHEFQQWRQHQSQRFQDITKLNPKQRHLALRALSYMGDYCAKMKTSLPLHIAWDKIKEAGFAPRNNALSSYLYMLSSNPDGSKESFSSYDGRDISGEVAMYHDFLYEPNENTVSIRIKKYVQEGNTKEAEALLWGLDVASTNALRLRTCLPILELYCQQGDLSSALRVYHQMRSTSSVHFEADTYVNFIISMARLGSFKCDADEIQSANELNYPPCGPSLLDRITTDMSEDILEITGKHAIGIRNAIVKGFHGMESIRNLATVPFDCSLASTEVPASVDELVANRITIDPNTMLCPRTNTKLRLIHLEKEQKKHMHTTLLKMADSQFEAYDAMLQSKGHKPSKGSLLEENYAAKHLEGFAEWLDTREGLPFTVIVDGANVAYYGIGNINYHQIKLVVETLERMGETPLVVIPQKYTQNKFYLRKGYIQELSPVQMDILNELETTGKLYKVPQRCLDDYYWMLSSVSNQTVSRNGCEGCLNVENEENRWPGSRPLIITNDQMRDHKLELLEPRLFRRWSSNTIVNYHIPPFSEEKDQIVTFETAEFISREIQGNTSDGGDLTWHFPVRDWGKNDRFCLRIPRSVK